MLLFGQELLEHVDPLLDKLGIESFADLILGVSCLPLMLLDQN